MYKSFELFSDTIYTIKQCALNNEFTFYYCLMVAVYVSNLIHLEFWWSFHQSLCIFVHIFGGIRAFSDFRNYKVQNWSSIINIDSSEALGNWDGGGEVYNPSHDLRRLVYHFIVNKMYFL